MNFKPLSVSKMSADQGASVLAEDRRKRSLTKFLPNLFQRYSRSRLSSPEAGARTPAPAMTGAKSVVPDRRSAAAAVVSGVTADDVIACIEMLLGRTPDASLVEYHLGLGFADRIALGRYMINTGEFQTRVSRTSRFVRSTSIFLGDRVLTSTHRGDGIYLVPLDLDLTPSIIRNGEWEAHVERAITRALRPGDVAVDIGANVGYHTLAMAAAVGSKGRVHAFEPSPDLLRLLRATIAVNGLDWVYLHGTATLDRPGTVKLASAPEHYGSGHVIPDSSPDHDPVYSVRVDVPAKTLDAVLAERVANVDLIRMDIEGSEPLALRGAETLIRRSSSMKIITEWSVEMMSSRVDIRSFVAWLVELGFRFWLIEFGGGLTPLAPSALLELPHRDLLLAREDPL
jgi:FkbM family methyltransferase